MSDLQLILAVNDASCPAYEVLVNDGGPDGGSNAQLYIGGAVGLDVSDLDNAVHAFAAALGAIDAHTIVSIKRLTTAETIL